jgi:SAM-dependent methyltransferase
VGIDVAPQRIGYAQSHYSDTGIEYLGKDIRKPLDGLGMFDFIWVRFVLEYYRLESFDIVKNISKVLKPGGILCLIDLDCNCMRHFGIPQRLETVLVNVMQKLEENFNFDPYAGIKLYSYLYDLDYQSIDVKVAPHNLIFGELKEIDNFNFTKKVEIAAKNSGYQFEGYEDGYEGFLKEFVDYFSDLRRFTYTPLISCRGRKPVS